MNTHPRIRAIVDEFLRSEYFANWQSEHIESGSYSRDEDRRDRFSRCYDAAEDGADGSTHREHIDDMRSAFKDWIRYGRHGYRIGRPCSEHPYRVESAVLKHFDDLEDWHTVNGSIDVEVG